MIQYNVYRLIQKIILVLVGISSCFIIFQKKPGFLPYINFISFSTTIIMLLIVMVNKIDNEKSIIVDDIDKHKKTLYRVLSLIVVLTVITMFILPSLDININLKFNDILGVTALGIALSTDLIASFLVQIMIRKDKRKFQKRYPSVS
ncbi:hypothetical protein OCE54_09155 [Bacillus cereus]|nr:hypothetical protein [Bacillus cereus]